MDAKHYFEGASKIAYPIISHELLDIICTEKEASADQKKEIKAISKNLGKRFYPEILFLLTFNEIDNPQMAEKICREISEHKKSLEKKSEDQLSSNLPPVTIFISEAKTTLLL